MNINNFIKSEKKEEISFEVFSEEKINSKLLDKLDETTPIDFQKELNHQQFNVIDKIKNEWVILWLFCMVPDYAINVSDNHRAV